MMKVRCLLNAKPTSAILNGRPIQAVSFSSDKNVSAEKGASKKNFFDQASRDWDKAWQMNLTPWDLKGTVTPPLKQLFDETSLGYQSVTGLDISPTAIQFATENIKNSNPQKKLPGNLKMKVADFFKYEAPEGHKYDFIFDYLFFAALDAPLRSRWADSMTRLLAPQRGYLATLIFPLAPPNISAEERAKGPPYPVSIEDYHAELTSDKWELVSINKDVKSIKPRMGREVMALWRLKQ
eukprot:gene4451-3183_t